MNPAVVFTFWIDFALMPRRWHGVRFNIAGGGVLHKGDWGHDRFLPIRLTPRTYFTLVQWTIGQVSIGEQKFHGIARTLLGRGFRVLGMGPVIQCRWQGVGI
jgi:hypothetical protein